MEDHTQKKRKLSSELTSNKYDTGSAEVEKQPASALPLDDQKNLLEDASVSDTAKTSRLSEDVNNHSTTEGHNIPDPVAGTCQFYLKRKHRYCKTLPYGTSKFCVGHSHEVLGDNGSRKRIPCPLDSKHSCYEDQLQKHLKICNVTKHRSKIPDFYVENINKGEDPETKDHVYKVSIRDISDSDVLELVKTVQRLHKEHVGKLETEILFHEILKQEAEKDKNGPAAQKHIHQQASIVEHLRQSGLLHDSCSYLEFGAGKGGLSHWVQLALKDAKHNQYILVDKGSVRYKMDNYHKGQDQGPTFERLKIDIQHLQLGKVRSISEDHRPLIGMGKHLCGGATDMMLRCLMESSFDEFKKNSQHSPVAGLVIALCCHHRCDWQTYVGKEFFRDCGLTARDFHLLTSMTSWATCGTMPAGKAATDYSTNQDEVLVPDVTDEDAKKNYHHHRYGNLLPEERELIGRQCKQLIDTGRRLYLASRGFHIKHVYYVDKKHTLENMILVATKLK